MSAIEVREHTVSVNGVELFVRDAGDPADPAVILSHGFPELGYSWRHQIPALVGAGYRVIVPDQRGYGRSSRPEAIADYDIIHLSGDLIGLLDEAGIERATVVGHDWGSMVVWQTALLHPDRVNGVVGMSVPFIPRGPMPPTQLMKMAFGDNFFYILYFQEPGVADAELGQDPYTTMRRLLCGITTANADGAGDIMATPSDGRGFVDRMPDPAELPAWLSQDELDHYASEFTRTGFTGGINWYRNFDRNWELTPHLADAKVEVPSLFIGGGADPVLVMSPPGLGDAFLTDHRGNVIIDGAGHWVQQETPEPVNAALISFLDDINEGNNP